MPVLVQFVGSSPRVRGTVPKWLASRLSSRFIPACAGNSRCRPAGLPCVSVHPRVCGEQRNRVHLNLTLNGSSPRVRGTVNVPLGSGGNTRFIPACAGNSRQSSVCTTRRAVHPRVCGEQPGNAAESSGELGSSPRVRGTVQQIADPPARDRFIPACAGNRVTSYNYDLPAPVHPRVCGEQRVRSAQPEPVRGSSPRVRGTGCYIALANVPSRFIPACAGNRMSVLLNSLIRPVHPRVCGEQSRSSNACYACRGSSPRVRGTGVRYASITNEIRFIPACAGNSLGYGRNARNRSVHPRVCGEQELGSLMSSALSGSSPRVRGTTPDRHGRSQI